MKRTLLNLASALFVFAALGGGISTVQASENYAVAAEMQEQVKASGKVVDQSGQPLIGVTVVQTGNETNGSMTNIDGTFQLTVPQGAQLTVSYIGFKTVTLPVSAGEMTITLEEDTVDIDDVVVVGYGVQKKANVSGAVSTVKMDDVLGDRPAPNVASALQGAMPGLYISANGSNNPGQTSKTIQIRGTKTFSNNSQAAVPTLIIIDNVEVTADDMNALSPSDIESVSVLKDASSAAIYGARAAGGVILITTKRPQKAEKISVNYNNNFGFVSPTGTPRQLELEQFLPIWREAFGNNYSAANQDIGKWLEYLSMYKSGNIAGLSAIGTLDPETGIFLEGDSKSKFYYLREQDIYERMFETGFSHNHNVSVSGATDRIRFRMSGNSYSENGPLQGKKDTYGRMTVNGMISADVAKWFTQEVDFSYSQQKRSNVSSARLYSLRLNNFLPEGRAPFTDYDFDTPLAELQNVNPTNTTINLPRVFLKSVIRPVKGLEAVFEYTYSKATTDQTRYRQQWSGYSFQEGVEQALSLGAGVTDDYYLYNSQREKNAFNIYGTYKFDVADDHHFSVMAGFSQEKLNYGEYNILAINQLVPSVPSLSAAQEVKTKGDYFYDYAIRSGFFRVNYDYRGKYIFEVSGRYDGSSKFPKASRFAFFPSFSVAWNLAEEKFMENTRDYIDQIKPRFSYGSIGNQQSAGYYDYIQGMTPDAEYNTWLDGNDDGYTGGISVPGATSANFTWETITTTNVGLDFSFFRNRLTGTFEWFQRDTKDILSTGVQLPGTFGTVAPNQNVGSLRTRGWELAINWRGNFAGQKGHYNVGLSLWDDKTVITRIIGNEGKSINSMYEGMTMGEIWGYVWDGFYTKEDYEDLSSWKLKDGVTKIQGTTPQPGDFKFKNLADNQLGEGVTDENQINGGLSTLDNPGDRRVIGNNLPRYQYGINLGVGYAGFDLSVMLQGVGRRNWNAGNNQLVFTGNGEVWLPVFEGTENYWSPMSVDPTDANYMVAANPDAKLPRIYGSMGNRSSNSRNSDYMLQDASYLRLKNITLAYTFPKKWMQKAYISNLRLFVSMENVATFSKLPRGIDPELLSWGFPMYRTVSFGLNVTF